ncbi:MarR family winged helix-turn-helix transcriptional regulator [Paenibacillus thalictri]|uniref:MarR family transcriptional regulator n=1 Tax=Paenibacillus thalictri TaxID=2527873 RepID=A0A4Q9DV19_9BACL|nr:MarR family transcriptional regulator [Paenibacillus thalictri]TBL80205.1 MarR family transcriptional regulator [Paenibacillus thalictri]
MEELTNHVQADRVREFILFIGDRVKQCSQSFEQDCRLSHHESSVLFALMQDGPLAVKDIAARLEVSLSTLTRILDSLEQTGYVKRNMDPKDRRSFIITLTADAERMLETFPAQMNKIALEMLDSLTVAERLILLELFAKMKATMISRSE